MSPHPMTKTATTPFERLLRSTKFKVLMPSAKLVEMLKHRTFKELLAQGYVLDALTFAEKIGYSRQHVYVLCREGKIDCIKRGYGAASAQVDEEFQYFFLPEQVGEFFAGQKGKS